MTAVLLTVQLVIVVTVTALMWLLPRTSRDTLPFGVRVPPGRTADPAITAATRGYRAAVLCVSLLSVVASAVLWPLMSAETAMSGGAALLVAGGIGAYAGAHRTVRRAKDREHWYAGLREGVAVDTGLRTDPVRVPWLWSLPSLVVIAVVAITGAVLYPGLPERLVISVRYHEGGTDYSTAATTVGSAFALVIIQVLVTALLLLILRFSVRARADIDAANPRESAERHRRFLRIWAYCLLATVFALNVAFGGLALIIWTGSLASAGPAVAAVVIVPLLTGAALLTGAGLLIGQSGWRMRDGTGEDTGFVQRDDDRYWHLAGTVYINRADPAILLPKRAAGLGWTVNLGRPAIWLVLGLTLGALAALAVVIVFGLSGDLETTQYGWQFGAGPLGPE
ncbi:putative membrane protein [Murinocardiopsis flavida]|uniref:Putative membrane protein n=1 Tax=Murinocardiopsis flavida TaxID=645275 RepID=A0A2P8CZ19_9ACTN|nr:DUF5808 domain-containing protein [Murinocardiopsis flavida]PSK90225.1 putative membrane protein [Murinocardiopsis flavida]